MTNRILVSLGALVAITMLSACGGGSSSGSGGSGTGISGTWAGPWVSASTNNGQLTVTLSVNGSGVVTGNVSQHTNTACGLTGFIGAFTASTGKLTGSFNGNGNPTSYSATLNGNTLSGNYTVTAGGCVGDTGTVVFTRQ